MNDMSQFEARVRRAYEYGRVRIGLAEAAWIILLASFLCTISEKQGATALVGIVLAIGAGWAAFRGRLVGAAAHAGLMAGLIPASFALTARNFGHAANAGGICVSWCMIGCAVGGMIAAGVIAKRAGRWRDEPLFWGISGLSVFAMGSLACSCTCFSALIALVASFIVSIFPARKFLLPALQGA